MKLLLLGRRSRPWLLGSSLQQGGRNHIISTLGKQANGNIEWHTGSQESQNFHLQALKLLPCRCRFSYKTCWVGNCIAYCLQMMSWMLVCQYNLKYYKSSYFPLQGFLFVRMLFLGWPIGSAKHWAFAKVFKDFPRGPDHNATLAERKVESIKDLWNKCFSHF